MASTRQNDPREWTIGYSESQDGNTNRYDLRTGETQSIRPRGPVDAAASPAPSSRRRPRRSQQAQQAPARRRSNRRRRSGAARRRNRGRRRPRRGPVGNIFPPPPPGTSYRFFWSTPFILSPHDPRTVYLGGERLFRSTTRGDTWTASPDLTKNIGRNDRPIMGVPGTAPMASKHDGAASYSNIVTISESPVVPGIVWVGTNDGNVQVSRDGGATWKNVVDSSARRAEGDTRLAGRAVAFRRRQRAMSRSMAIAPTITSLTCS